MASKIRPGDLVTVRYRVFAGKEVVDASEEPFTFEVGSGRFLPPVEKALIGHQPGERIVVFVPPEEHYGPYDPKKLQLIAVEKLPPNVNPGDVVRVQDEMGIVHPAVLRRRDEEVAWVDLNHPLAGKLLRFEIEILDVTPKEAASEKKEEPGRDAQTAPSKEVTDKALETPAQGRENA
ncbi:MAG: hypothetical protein GXO17_01035 [Thermodesulfobacteria bacterium]|nr:hypothetical protein [Thermodesulfobacteriota bacterium]